MAMNYETLDKKIDSLGDIWGKRIFDTQDRIHELKELREETENRISHIRSVQEPWNVDVIKRLELLEQDDSNVTTRRDMAIKQLSGRLDELEYAQDNLGVEVGVVGWLKNLQTTVEGLQTSMVQAQGKINLMWTRVMGVPPAPLPEEEPLYGPALTAEDDTEGPDSLYVDGWGGWPNYLRGLALEGRIHPLGPQDKKKLCMAAGVIDQLINYVKKMEEGGR